MSRHHSAAETAPRHIPDSEGGTGTVIIASHQFIEGAAAATPTRQSVESVLTDMRDSAVETVHDYFFNSKKFHHDNPTTAIVEALLPPVELFHMGAAAVAGVTRGNHMAEKAPTTKDQTQTKTAKPENNDPEKAQPASATKRQPGDDTGTNGHNTHTVKAGEGYWTIAREGMKPGYNNQDIADRVAVLRALNKNRVPVPGETILLD